jgi:hypothetical protein
MIRPGLRNALLMALLASASPPALAGDDVLNCAIRRGDCATMLAAIEWAIPEDRLLASLRRMTDQRLTELAAALDPLAARALRHDEAVFRQSLHRDLAFAADDLPRDVDSLHALGERLAGRLEMLAGLDPDPVGLAGEWVSATGSVIIAASGGGFEVTAYNVEPNRLAWACEFFGHGQSAGATITVENDGIDQVALAREGAALRLVHTVAEGHVAWSCGANGSLSGVYFRRD